ncbi:hypothetical protein [Catellatospora sichuanensis]|uniref:hypothetical protein n=1 Tax=Catellatospora sichuanensis TaxID=1969805 RepID=UPI001182EF94|nr:hypothetical protein [Catellatospora sichuanensis]
MTPCRPFGRTLYQLRRPGADTDFDGNPSRDVLDRIDEIVPPDTVLNQADAGYQPPAITDPTLRRRREVTPAR